MTADIEPTRFIAGLRFVANDIRSRGVRDIRLQCGEDFISAGWQQDDTCAGSEESLALADEIEALALRMEYFGINSVSLMQTNETINDSGRTEFTGKRSMSAHWKWNQGASRGTIV
jgi:hypothetical protein